MKHADNTFTSPQESVEFKIRTRLPHPTTMKALRDIADDQNLTYSVTEADFFAALDEG